MGPEKPPVVVTPSENDAVVPDCCTTTGVTDESENPLTGGGGGGGVAGVTVTGMFNTYVKDPLVPVTEMLPVPTVADDEAFT
jgi:hypothetical protein